MLLMLLNMMIVGALCGAVWRKAVLFQQGKDGVELLFGGTPALRCWFDGFSMVFEFATNVR
jgi:hypothetical protein